jgi:hypothetical protein
MAKFIIAMALIFSTLNAFSAEITGVVELGNVKAESLSPNGALFIYARMPGMTAGPPLAVLKIANPKFPQKFVLTGKNVMMGGPESFTGSMNISAKFAPSGDALDKTGPSGTDEKNKTVAVGFKDLKIKLNK